MQLIAFATGCKMPENIMETKLAALRVEVSKETGEVMLFIETACGPRPVMGWPNLGSLRDFAENLLGICSNFKGKKAPGTSCPVDDGRDIVLNGN
jgi:hypothetical protein